METVVKILKLTRHELGHLITALDLLIDRRVQVGNEKDLKQVTNLKKKVVDARSKTPLLCSENVN